MFKKKVQSFFLRVWSTNSSWHLVFYPLSFLFYLLTRIRKALLLFIQKPLACPVVVVGNVTVGGTGKTTFVIALIRHFRSKGYHVGVVSRGYKRKYSKTTLLIDHDMGHEVMGDEARMIWLQTQTPICLSPNRHAAAVLLSEMGADLIISDDGLQNYALPRGVEICLMPDESGFGNGLLLPLGPLRELKSRAEMSDFVIYPHQKSSLCESHTMSYEIDCFESLDRRLQYSLDDWPHQKNISALCAIGNPDGFFSLLSDLGFTFDRYELHDHSVISLTDILDLPDDKPILITEKDAVKIDFPTNRSIWVVKIKPKFNHDVCQMVEDCLLSKHLLKLPLNHCDSQI
ncbi:MAG: tetraacyldisaccharide 4'-kinase [Pseudomonadota bacterium]|nr:tetraacyldisaccharide 4'-kinase [Pseudomonadota bacterium]